MDLCPTAAEVGDALAGLLHAPLAGLSQHALYPIGPPGTEVLGEEHGLKLLPCGGGGTRSLELLIPGLGLPCQRVGEEWDPRCFLPAQVQAKEPGEGQEEGNEVGQSVVVT